MEEKNEIKINLSTLFLILAIIAIIIMSIFIYKLYNDKTIETNKSLELQSQVDSLNNSLSDLQGKLNTISETINPNENNNTITNSNSNSNDSTKNTNANFSEKEIKNALQNCLDLESAKSNGPFYAVITLGLANNSSDVESDLPANKTGFIRTTIKFSDFKESILKYMTEKCYQEQWSEYFEDEDGYFCYDNVGASGIGYKVNSIKKDGNEYTADVTASSEGPDRDVTIKFTLDDNNCIIDSYKFI